MTALGPTFFTLSNPVVKEEVACCETVSLLPSLLQGVAHYYGPPFVGWREALEGSEGVKEERRNLITYLFSIHLEAKTSFTTGCERSVKEVKEGSVRGALEPVRHLHVAPIPKSRLYYG